MAERLTARMDVMRTTRTEVVIVIDPEYADDLFDSLKRAEALCRGRRDRLVDADRLEQLAGAVIGGAEWSTRMAEA